MQWGAYFSVAALLNSSSGPAGIISYYLSTNYKIPQGLGYAVSGVYFFKRNHEKGFHKYSKLFDLIENKPKKNFLTEKKKSKFVVDSLLKILHHNEITLKKFNIPKPENKKIYRFISNKINKFGLNNPVKLNKNDFKIIIKNILQV